MSDTNIEAEKKATVKDPLRRLYDFWAERAAEHRSTANLLEFLHEGLEDDALESQNFVRSNRARTSGQDGGAFETIQGLLRLGTHRDARIES
ncbi:unnamed protein product [Prunus armeniaca]|uniref:Uncharacterized protein n=1 Tax=Prunus armeniaca TaxID=36596 RepID=A0A6J5VPA4_PRUAR|nr:unnamed protein product [Prunus armeniaca]